jgi:hypothetical protein
MTYAGHVQDGQIVLDYSVVLPEGARVKIDLVDEVGGNDLHPDLVKMIGVLNAGEHSPEQYYQAMYEKHSCE